VSCTSPSVLMRSPPKVKVMPQVTGKATYGGVVSGWAQLDLGDWNRVWAMSWLVALGASSLATSSSRGDS